MRAPNFVKWRTAQAIIEALAGFAPSKTALSFFIRDHRLVGEFERAVGADCQQRQSKRVHACGWAAATEK